jgi:hypothetical protein
MSGRATMKNWWEPSHDEWIISWSTGAVRKPRWTDSSIGISLSSDAINTDRTLNRHGESSERYT